MNGRPALLLSIDFEDWHQLVHRRLGLPDWDRPYAALERQTGVLLDLLDELGARATFFLLGMSVANHRDLITEIVRRGLEPACHGYAHTRVYQQTRDDFRADLERAVELIVDVTGRKPAAYRAPAFSINRETPWAYEVLAEAGFDYDSSQYDSPRVHDRIGAIPAAPTGWSSRSAPSSGSSRWPCGARFPWAGAPTGDCSHHRSSALPSTASADRRRTRFCIFIRTNSILSRSERRFQPHHPSASGSQPRHVASGGTRAGNSSPAGCVRRHDATT